MQDLIQNYVSDSAQAREVFHKKKPLAPPRKSYRRQWPTTLNADAAMASVMEKFRPHKSEPESSAAARLNQLCSLRNRQSDGRR